jgi:EmrB/QacA subfamily drug resistance transporter
MNKIQRRSLLFGLVAPFLMSVMNLTMFRVALPTIRGTFNIPADSTAWLATAYNLAYMVFMPLYGFLGDRLSKRRIFIAGIGIFFVGTLFIQLSPIMELIVLGRVIQAVGVSGVSPLCIAAITNRFPAEERGTALGQWNSSGSFAAMLGPFLAGFLIDFYGWRAIYGPILLIGAAAFLVVWKLLPSAQPARQNSAQESTVLKDFDWIGFLFLGLFLSLFVFYLSSRPLTGRHPLSDWRLGVGATVSLILLIVWEKRSAHPVVPLDLLRFGDFASASFCSATRMFILGSIGLLVPLYLTEIHGMSAAWIGSVLAGTYLSFFISMRLGGKLADRWGSRWLVVTGLLIQGSVLVFMALVDDSVSSWYIVPVLLFHGLGAGSYLAPLHRAAMARVPKERSGAGAGFYSSIRFGGVLLGPTIAGVLLENGLMRYSDALQAYQRTFWIIAAAAAVGIVIALRIKD